MLHRLAEIVPPDTGARVHGAWARLEEIGAEALEMAPVLGIGVLIVLFAWLAGRVLTSWALLFRWAGNEFVQSAVKQATRSIFVIVGVLITLELLGATALVGAVLGTAGVIGIAVGFAFRDLIENYLAGILLSLRQPFQPNDAVDIDGHAGKVVRLTSRSTILLTAAGNHVRIPNAIVFKSVMVNYTRNPMRRFDFVIGVGTNEDLQAAQEQGVRILDELDAVIDKPKPFCLVEELGDSSVALHFFGWVDQLHNDFFKTRSEAIRLVKTAFDQAGIDMPEPIYRVHLTQMDKPKPEAPPKSLTTVSVQQQADTSVDHHLDEQVALERARESDLLTTAGKQE